MEHAFDSIPTKDFCAFVAPKLEAEHGVVTERIEFEESVGVLHIDLVFPEVPSTNVRHWVLQQLAEWEWSSVHGVVTDPRFIVVVPAEA